MKKRATGFDIHFFQQKKGGGGYKNKCNGSSDKYLSIVYVRWTTKLNKLEVLVYSWFKPPNFCVDVKIYGYEDRFWCLK